MKPRRIDIAMVIILPIIATLITFVCKTSLFVSTLLFFAAPTVYLTFRNPGIFKKSFLFAFLFSIPLSLFIDILATINGAWVIESSIFPVKLLGIATIENYFYGLLWVLYAVIFYEHFFDKGRKRDKTSPHIKYLLYLSGVLLAYIFLGIFMIPGLLYIPYFYLVMGISFVIMPLVLFLYHYPIFTRRYIVLGIYFFSVLFLFEIAAIYAGQWTFPGDFIGFVTLFGFRFPVEELIFCMATSTLSILSYYEFCDDDEK